MNKLLPMIKADFIKMKNTPFYWIHICVPITGIVMFLGYYSFTTWSTTSKIQGYLQALSMVFPILIGIVSSMVIDQEAMAGRFKEMLGAVYGKQLSLISKLVMLLISGFISSVVAVGGFLFGFEFILHQNVLPISFYGDIILIIFGSQIFLYLFHIWLSLLWGNGASIGIGIFESLFSALVITGLGDGIWQWIPCGWGMRFSDYFLIKWNSLGGTFNQLSDFNSGIVNCIIFTMMFGIFLGIWFNFYEGRKEK
jgi:ABC-2 type transport system permease protein